MKTTKKLFALLLALSTLFVFFGCSAAKDSENDYPNAGDIMNGLGAIESPNYNLFPDGAIPPAETPDENKPSFVENPFVATAENNVSTFSADVDTASYTYFRKLINQGYKLEDLIREGGAFRTEEFINYFDYTATAPNEGELFGVYSEMIACPWNTSTTLLRLTLQAEEIVDTAGNNLVFLIDVSGSMYSADKLPLLKKSFTHLLGHLTERDTVSIVTYSGREEVVLDGCPGNQSERILQAINGLVANGSTNGEAGLEKAYTIAQKHKIANGNNRIIMASDGDLNVGISSKEQLTAYIAEKRDAGIFLSVLGFGTGNYRDSNMEALADNGNGVYYYIDGESEAERVLGSDILSTLYTVAKDVKMQITFDTRYVNSYRLIGYENRILNEEDFTNDKKDAGDVGAGHQITVCYELTLAEGARQTEDAWMELAVNYKLPTETVSQPVERYAIGKDRIKDSLSDDTVFLTSVIQCAMLLHQSRYLEGVTMGAILENLQALDLSEHPERAEFRELIDRLV